MKTAITTILFLVLIIAAGSLIAIHAYKAPAISDVSVLWDVTDSLIAKPDAKGILGLYDFTGENKWNGGVFSFTDISDVSYNKTSQVKIAAANKWLSNEPERDKDITGFQTGIADTIAVGNNNQGRRHSSVYIPIANELNRLSQSTSQRKVLIIYSDLMENDIDISFYSKPQFQALQKNPELFQKLFGQRVPLQQLTGINVYFIYQPGTVEQDNQFRIVSGFYKNLLESKGATVHIAANLLN